MVSLLKLITIQAKLIKLKNTPIKFVHITVEVNSKKIIESVKIEQ